MFKLVPTYRSLQAPYVSPKSIKAENLSKLILPGPHEGVNIHQTLLT